LDRSSSSTTAIARRARFVSAALPVGLLLVCAVIAATPAYARRVTIASWPYESPFAQTIALPSAIEKTDRPATYPSTDLLSSGLGIEEGKLQFFHYSLEHAPSKATVLEGVVDGDGIRLKMSW
jgi:hypothetical protein